MGVINIECEIGQYATFPFKDDSFDSVTMVFAVNYIENLNKVFFELKRVLKKDGNIVIVQSKKILPKYETQEVKKISNWRLKRLLKKRGFRVKIDKIKVEKKVLYFIEAILEK